MTDHCAFQTLITAPELLRNSSNPDWLVIDCRHDLSDPQAGRAAYQGNHIPGAVFAHLDADLAGEKLGADGSFRGRHPLPQSEQFIDTLRRLGVNQRTQVVAYDAHGGMFAARLWWMLRWVGHAQVAVLDGGLQGWSAAGGTLEAQVPVAVAGDITLRAPLVSTVSMAQLVANLHDPRLTVLDARAADRYRGENETLDPVGGHIPGAKNRCFRDNLQADGRFKSAAQLHTEFASVLTSARDSVMQCGSGVTACHNLLALEVAGMQGAALYPGSWSEWCSEPSRPISQGSVS